MLVNQVTLQSKSKDLGSVLANLNTNSGDAVLSSLLGFNRALVNGGHPAAEEACRLGGLRISVDLLKSKSPEVLEQTVEALWLLVDDHESCQELITLNGHQEMWQILTQHQSHHLTRNVFRLLAETLYGEKRSSKFWKDGLDGHFLSQALEWSIEESMTSTSSNSLGFVCDVTALWLQRCPADSVKALLHTIPALLRAMANRPSDPLLVQHGCRLLWAMADVTTKAPGSSWPEAFGQPTLEALEQLRQKDLPQHVMHYHAMAIHMVKRMTEAKSSMSLDAMDWKKWQRWASLLPDFAGPRPCASRANQWHQAATWLEIWTSN